MVVWATTQSFSVRRGFEIEVNGRAVTVPYAVGLSSLEWTWGEPESGKPYRVRVRERVFSAAGDGTVETRFSPWVSSSVACERFVPQDFEASCNAHGVVEARWDPVNGASLYQVEWLPQHEVGSNKRRNVTSTNPTWQGDEGGTYKLRVSAYSKAAKKWSGFSPQETVTCPEITFPTQRWATPNRSAISPLGDPDTEITGYVLISRRCPTTRLGDQTTRTCTEVWEENITIRVDQRQWWKRLPLADWSDRESVDENIATLGGLAGAILARRHGGRSARPGFNFTVTVTGTAQVKGYLRITDNERVFLAVTAYPPGPVVGCLPPGYTTQTATLNRQTSTNGNHTTHRDITVHYCKKG